MAVQQRVRVPFEDVFPHGAFMLGAAEPVEDFDLVQKAKEAGREPGDVQVRDKVTGRRVWAVRVLDPDPEARKGQAELVVKIDADQCPVPPTGPLVGPFRPVAFEGMTITPYVDDNGRRPKVAYSMRAAGFADTNAKHGQPAAAPKAAAS
jgi:hypothetical protein